MPSDAHIGDEFVMPRRLVVEAEPLPRVADGVNAGRHIDKTARPKRSSRRQPARVVDRIGRVLREGVQDIGDQQFLVLLLMMQANFQDRKHAFGIRPPALARSAARLRHRHGRDSWRHPRRPAS